MRQLVRGQVKFIGKKKKNPFKKGEFSVGVCLKIVDGPDAEWINVAPESHWLQMIQTGRFVFLVKEWSTKKLDPETKKEGAYAYRPIQVDNDFNVVPAATAPGIDQKAASFLVSLLTWLSSPIGGISPMRRMLAALKEDLLIDTNDERIIGRAFKESIQLAKLVGPEIAPQLLKPRQDYEGDILTIESSLQQASEENPDRIPSIIDAIQLSRFPREIRRRINNIIDSYLDEANA